MSSNETPPELADAALLTAEIWKHLAELRADMWRSLTTGKPVTTGSYLALGQIDSLATYLLVAARKQG